MNPDQYTVVINGKPQGPYNLSELKDLNITANTFIRKPGMDDYKEAHAIPELRELLGFSYQKTAPQYFAAFDQRLLASVTCSVVNVAPVATPTEILHPRFSASSSPCPPCAITR